MTRLADVTWTDVAAADRRVLVLPVGAHEQHGPHLPIDTDAFLTAAVTDAVEQTRPWIGLAPTLPVGASGEHAAFPGTLSIGTDGLVHTVVELVRHAGRDWQSVLVVNGHGGNAEGLDTARDTCRREDRRLEVIHLGVPGMDAHAGHAETSLLLHLAPERVRTANMRPGNTTPIEQLLPELRHDGVRAVTADGVLGDPTTASAGAGAELFARLVDEVGTAVDALAASLEDGVD